MFVGAEKVKEKTFRQILTDQSSLLHLCCCIAHVSMANRFSVLKVTSQNYSGLEKFFEIKTFLEPAFPTVIWSVQCNLWRSFFVWLHSGVTVIGSISLVWSSQPAAWLNLPRLWQIQLPQWNCIVWLHSKFCGQKVCRPVIISFGFVVKEAQSTHQGSAKLLSFGMQKVISKDTLSLSDVKLAPQNLQNFIEGPQ